MYRMTADYHTHTVYSPGLLRPHGKGTIEENVREAALKGLDEIAISDHGPGHLTYGLRIEKIREMRKEIERLQKIYKSIKIYLSVEANILESENNIDVKPDEFSLFDFVNCGYHYGIKNGHCIENYRFMHSSAGRAFENGEIGSRQGKKLEDLIEKNTRMVIGAVEKNDIKILTHPGDKAPIDMDEVARACEKTDTLMEISTFHRQLTVEGIRSCAKYDVRFVISSDAHIPSRVGVFEQGLERAIAAGLDPERVVNIEKIS